MKGIRVDIYRPADNRTDCTNNGVTSARRGHMTALVIGPGVPGVVEPMVGEPVLVLTQGHYNTAKLVPRELIHNHTWHMFGGNFAYTSDPRLAEAVHYMTHTPAAQVTAIQIFDRVEN